MKKITIVCTILAIGITGCFGGGGGGGGWECTPGLQFCWKYVSSAKNYKQAKQACQSVGGELATMETMDKAHFMKGFLKYQHIGKNIPYIWVGGNDLGYESIWHWDGFSKELIDLHSKGWLPGEPNNFSTGEHCMCVWRKGGWNDCHCHVKRPFICEKPNASGY